MSVISNPIAISEFATIFSSMLAASVLLFANAISSVSKMQFRGEISRNQALLLGLNLRLLPS